MTQIGIESFHLFIKIFNFIHFQIYFQMLFLISTKKIY